ncbi:MAG: SUMF1/EgtB/PvdO family nonheme iron enzyme [SAR324 cluster bacterium]|nr:SUMF1/EgtB/PvdO family nonheme iron enzyme [SAR324 cluster bacterium]
MRKFFLLSCLFFFLGQTSFAQPTEELPIEWDGFRERLLTLALDPSVLAPVLAIVPVPPAGSEEVTEISRQLQQLLFLGLSPDLPRQLIHPPQLQRILDDWNGSLRLQSRPLTNRELAGLAGADWLLEGLYSQTQDGVQVDLELQELLTNRVLLREQLTWPIRLFEIPQAPETAGVKSPAESTEIISPSDEKNTAETEIATSADTSTISTINETTTDSESATTPSVTAVIPTTPSLASVPTSEVSEPESLPDEPTPVIPEPDTTANISEVAQPEVSPTVDNPEGVGEETAESQSIIAENEEASTPTLDPINKVDDLQDTETVAMIAPSTEAIEAEPEDSAEMKMTVENTAADNNSFDSSYTQSLSETSAEPDPTAALVIPKGSSDRPGMALLEGGSFQMGSLEGEDDEWPTRQIELASFYLDVHEVTNADYAQCSECMRGYGGFDTTLPEQPVVYVDWENSARYCASIGKRLPTEAEWEYATQAGSDVENSDSVLAELREQAWFEITSQDLRSAAVVGQRQPNVWGLYDLQGNVMEWTADWYAPYDQAKLQNPKGPEAPPNPTYPQKVARGGAWQGLFGRATEAGLRSSRRYGLAAWTQAFNLGFRCAADAL